MCLNKGCPESFLQLILGITQGPLGELWSKDFRVKLKFFLRGPQIVPGRTNQGEKDRNRDGGGGEDRDEG